MTVYRTKANRAIARSRGHLKQAEESVQHERPMAARFSVEKAGHALQVGMLHEAERAADAQEMSALIQFLDVDPETVLGEAVSGVEYDILIGKVRQWLLSKIETTKEEESDD